VRCAQPLCPRGQGFGRLRVTDSASDAEHNNAIQHWNVAVDGTITNGNA